MRTDAQMDYNGEAGSRFSQFCERAKQNYGILYSPTNSPSAIRRQNNKAGYRVCRVLVTVHV
jgi:hypothetical protein